MHRIGIRWDQDAVFVGHPRVDMATGWEALGPVPGELAQSCPAGQPFSHHCARSAIVNW